MKKASFKGATTEFMTTYLPSGEIDHEGMRRMVEFQISSGTKGLFVNGLGTESMQMTLEEQAAIADTIIKAAAGRVPVMTNVFTESIDFSLKLLKMYEASGPDLICITQPTTVGYPDEALYEFFSAIIKATDLPVHLYNAPSTGNPMSEKLIARLINEYDNVVGYKDSTMSVLHLQNVMRFVEKPGVEYIAGSDSTILSTLALGGHGIVSFVTTVFPKPVIELCDAFFAGDLERARELQRFVLEIRALMKLGTDNAGYRYASELVGMPIHGTRMPPSLEEISDDTKKIIREGLGKLGLI